MKNNFNKFFVLIFVLLLFLIIGTVSAADNLTNDNDLSSSTEDVIIEVSIDNGISAAKDMISSSDANGTLKSTNEDKLSEDWETGTFSELE